MKAFGVIRKIDELGRVVLPAGLRKNLGIQIGDSLEIFTEEDRVILKKYELCDIFTGETEDLIDFKGKKVSKSTILELAKLVED